MSKLRKKIVPFLLIVGMAWVGASCGAKGASSSSDSVAAVTEMQEGSGATDIFSADSAYVYVERQVAFGPRVPNTEAHRRTGDWLYSELQRHGAQMIDQRMTLRAFDGTDLSARNIMGRYNPEATERTLLVAHWDCRPWADEDPDESKRSLPVDGANDGASGVGVLLEVARRLGESAPAKGVDILFVDAEDWGSSGDSDSWALGAKYFVENPPVTGYAPDRVILLDMVGGKDAKFYREYFSETSAPDLNDELWVTGGKLGYGNRFINRIGTAVTDDHVHFIAAGIPSVDIIEYNPGEGGFNSRWHTTSDNMAGISAETLGIVGTTLMTYLLNQ